MSEHTFIGTQEHRRFAEFCDACRHYRYIGLCYGAPGVGKTVSAESYTEWKRLQKLSSLQRNEIPPTKRPFKHRAILYTVAVAAAPGRIEKEVRHLRSQFNYVLIATKSAEENPAGLTQQAHDFTELIIIDEADRLGTNPLELVRDIYDRTQVSVILIGMPGIEKRLARYPQLYSRVGFVHHFRPLSVKEMRRVLPLMWQLADKPATTLDEEAMRTIMRMAGGNFRLIQRLLSQIERVLDINNLTDITKEVIETARKSLIIGET